MFGSKLAPYVMLLLAVLFVGTIIYSVLNDGPLPRAWDEVLVVQKVEREPVIYNALTTFNVHNFPEDLSGRRSSKHFTQILDEGYCRVKIKRWPPNPKDQRYYIHDVSKEFYDSIYAGNIYPREAFAEEFKAMERRQKEDAED